MGGKIKTKESATIMEESLHLQGPKRVVLHSRLAFIHHQQLQGGSMTEGLQLTTRLTHRHKQPYTHAFTQMCLQPNACLWTVIESRTTQREIMQTWREHAKCTESHWIPWYEAAPPLLRNTFHNKSTLFQSTHDCSVYTLALFFQNHFFVSVISEIDVFVLNTEGQNQESIDRIWH